MAASSPPLPTEEFWPTAVSGEAPGALYLPKHIQREENPMHTTTSSRTTLRAVLAAAATLAAAWAAAGAPWTGGW